MLLLRQNILCIILIKLQLEVYNSFGKVAILTQLHLQKKKITFYLILLVLGRFYNNAGVPSWDIQTVKFFVINREI